MSFPTAQQVNLPACSSLSPFKAEGQAGKLRILLLNNLDGLLKRERLLIDTEQYFMCDSVFGVKML